MSASSSAALAASPANSRPGWLVVMAAFFGVMVGFGSMLVFTFSVFLKPLGAEFGWSRESVSAAFGVAAMTVAVCSPVLGRLLDRYGPRPVILPCMVLFGCAFASLSLLKPSLLHLYATFLVLGAVGNGTTQMGYSRAVSTWFTARRGTALALVMAGTGVGSMVFPPLAQWIIDTQGWRSAYVVLGGLVLIFGVPLTAVFVRERPQPVTQHRGASSASAVRAGLRSKPFWLLVVILFLSSIAVNGAITHMSALLTDRGSSASDAALAVSVLGGMSLVGRLCTGALLDRYFGPWVSFVLLGGVAAGILMLALTTSPWGGVGAAALIGLGLGGEADVTPYLLTRYFGISPFSTLYGFTWTAYAIAGAVGPVLMGRVFDVTGSYVSLLAVLAVQTLISAVLCLFLPSYPQLREQD
jgi:predicted MFS family arabinose efflux permease